MDASVNVAVKGSSVVVSSAVRVTGTTGAERLQRLSHSAVVHCIRFNIKYDVSWHTTEASFTQEEEDAILTLVVVVIGVIAAIVILFSMGIFIDCRHQNKDGMTKKRLRVKMPPLRHRRNFTEDGKSLASEMCPNGDSDLGGRTDIRDAVV